MQFILERRFSEDFPTKCCSEGVDGLLEFDAGGRPSWHFRREVPSKGYSVVLRSRIENGLRRECRGEKMIFLEVKGPICTPYA